LIGSIKCVIITRMSQIPEYDYESHPDRARRIILAGFDRAEVAKQFGIELDRLKIWEMGYPHFAAAMRGTRLEHDSRVVDALYARATGRGAKRTVKTVTKADGAVETHETVEEMLPDVTAQKFWLTNRQPGQWQERHEVRGEIEHEITINLPWMSGGRNLVIDVQDVQEIPTSPQSDAPIASIGAGLSPPADGL
jgi:hypothetical protein